jgi:hypothetical protein
LELEEIEGRKLVLKETQEEKAAGELIARAEAKRAEERRHYKGPWHLIARKIPYSSKKFKLDRAKKILADEEGKKDK